MNIFLKKSFICCYNIKKHRESLTTKKSVMNRVVAYTPDFGYVCMTIRQT